MISRVFAATLASRLTPVDAVSHWRDVHAGLGAALPGLVRYVQYHPALDAAGQPVRLAAGRGVVSLLEFADRPTLEQAFGVDGGSHPALAAANEDEDNFIEPGPSAGLVGQRSTVSGDPGESAVVVVVTGGLGGRPLPVTARSHETIVATPPPLPWDDETWPAVDLVGFGSVDDARAALPDGSITVPFTVVERTG
ncbi:hypothetical protein BH24ACT5_BH24ACT5_13500 [soil metagenome]